MTTLVLLFCSRAERQCAGLVQVLLRDVIFKIHNESALIIGVLMNYNLYTRERSFLAQVITIMASRTVALPHSSHTLDQSAIVTIGLSADAVHFPWQLAALVEDCEEFLADEPDNAYFIQLLRNAKQRLSKYVHSCALRFIFASYACGLQ